MVRKADAPISPRNALAGLRRRNARVGLWVVFSVVSVVLSVRSVVSPFAQTTLAQTFPAVPAETLPSRDVLTALDEELSGVAAKDHVARLTQFHRVPASPGFHDTIEDVMNRAKAVGLSDVQLETFPSEGTTWI